MKSLYYIFIGLLFVVMTDGCKKPKDCTIFEISNYRVSPRIITMIFKPGSYWIYKNIQDNSIDSMYVTKLDSGVSAYSPDVNCTFAKYYVATFRSQKLGEFTLLYKQNQILSEPHIVKSVYYGTPEYYNSDSLKSSSENIEYLQQYHSLTVQFSTYYFVDKIRVQNSRIGGKNAIMYWANSTGFLKIEKENGEVWELYNRRTNRIW